MANHIQASSAAMMVAYSSVSRSSSMAQSFSAVVDDRTVSNATPTRRDGSISATSAVLRARFKGDPLASSRTLSTLLSPGAQIEKESRRTGTGP